MSEPTRGPTSPPADRTGCPAPEALLAAIRGEGDEAERLDVLDHALSCPHCRPELALLHGVAGAEPRASRLAAWRWRRLAPLALAATVVLAAGVFGTVQWINRGEPMRNGGNAGVALAGPADGATVTEPNVTFAWRPVAGALRYTVVLDATDGTLLFRASTTDTTLAAAVDTVARGGHRWSVRAELNDGSQRRSELREVRLR
jgi:hypothetical protein